MEEKQRRGMTSSNKRNSGVTGGAGGSSNMRNSGVTGGGGGAGGSPPPTSDREISADLPGKRQGKNEKGVKIEKKRRKIVKGKVEN